MKLVQMKMNLIFRYWMMKLLQSIKKLINRDNHDEHGNEMREGEK